jgi:hypothetical protein
MPNGPHCVGTEQQPECKIRHMNLELVYPTKRYCSTNKSNNSDAMKSAVTDVSDSEHERLGQ